jgi:hypothetical protein
MWCVGDHDVPQCLKWKETEHLMLPKGAIPLRQQFYNTLMEHTVQLASILILLPDCQPHGAGDLKYSVPG